MDKYTYYELVYKAPGNKNWYKWNHDTNIEVLKPELERFKRLKGHSAQILQVDVVKRVVRL